MRALLLALVLTVLWTPPALAQGLTVQVLRAPEVIVASDFEGEERTTPSYLWSVEARVTNGDVSRGVTLHAVTYLDRETTGCPERDTGVRPTMKFAKNLQLGPGERETVGGSLDQAETKAYWPHEVFERYPTPTGSVATYAEGEHGFCVLALVSGRDPACEKPESQVCTLASAPFRAYVRHGNTAPAITSVSVSPETPRPGQEVLLSAQATDPDTRPRPDTVRVDWDVGPRVLTGATVRHAFPTQGPHEVVLRVSDGFVVTERTVTVNVTGPPIEGGGDGGNGTPGPPLPLLLVVLAAAGARAARRRQG